MENLDLNKMDQLLGSLKLSQKESEMIKGGTVPPPPPPGGGPVPGEKTCSIMCQMCIALCTTVCSIDEP